jgi:hypothetical protein
MPEISTGNVPTSNFSFASISNYMKQKRTTVSLAKRYEMREYGRMHVNLHIHALSSYSNITHWLGRLVEPVSGNKCDGEEEYFYFFSDQCPKSNSKHIAKNSLFRFHMIRP